MVTYLTEDGHTGVANAFPCAACDIVPSVCFFLKGETLGVAGDRAVCADCLEDLLGYARSFDPAASRQAIQPSVVRRWLRLVGVPLEDL